MQAEAVTALRDQVLRELDEMKAREVVALDVRALTSMADFLVICCGTSTRHCKSIAQHVVEQAKTAGVMPLGVEGEQGGEWILVDLGDVIVHVMLREARDYYQLEKLWDPDWGVAKSAPSDS
ncbi:MAG TPA: ribosome silencing factor [Permianibacter sp.]|nr:ribosome silencing factor [Permianibacter sp.]